MVVIPHMITIQTPQKTRIYAYRPLRYPEGVTNPERRHRFTTWYLLHGCPTTLKPIKPLGQREHRVPKKKSQLTIQRLHAFVFRLQGFKGASWEPQPLTLNSQPEALPPGMMHSLSWVFRCRVPFALSDMLISKTSLGRTGFGLKGLGFGTIMG